MKQLRTILPTSLKIKFRLVKRFYADYRMGILSRFAHQSHSDVSHYDGVVSIPQRLDTTPNFQNKVHNIKLAAQRINNCCVAPGDIFSFWKLVGNPTKEQGYLVGRNLQNGQLSESYGGGLCQLSSLLYHLTLLAGLSVMERYNHSVDIYQEDSRFTPLGADATVAYAYKDFRFKNTSSFSICFFIEIKDNLLIASVLSEGVLNTQRVYFVRYDASDSRIVRTMNEKGVELACSVYRF